MKASVSTTILKLMNGAQKAFLIRGVGTEGKIQLVGNVTTIGTGTGVVCVCHMRCWILTEGNVRHQRDDRCLESLEFRDSGHGAGKGKRQEKGKEKQAKNECVKFLVVVNFWSCRNAGRVEMLVVVALVRASKKN